MAMGPSVPVVPRSNSAPTEVQLAKESASSPYVHAAASGRFKPPVRDEDARCERAVVDVESSSVSDSHRRTHSFPPPRRTPRQCFDHGDLGAAVCPCTPRRRPRPSPSKSQTAHSTRHTGCSSTTMPLVVRRAKNSWWARRCISTAGRAANFEIRTYRLARAVACRTHQRTGRSGWCFQKLLSHASVVSPVGGSRRNAPAAVAVTKHTYGLRIRYTCTAQTGMSTTGGQRRVQERSFAQTSGARRAIRGRRHASEHGRRKETKHVRRVEGMQNGKREQARWDETNRAHRGNGKQKDGAALLPFVSRHQQSGSGVTGWPERRSRRLTNVHATRGAQMSAQKARVPRGQHTANSRQRASPSLKQHAIQTGEELAGCWIQRARRTASAQWLPWRTECV